MEPVLRVMENTAGPAGDDLAREERLLSQAPGAVLFLYSWPHPSLVLGHGQSGSTVDLEFAHAQRITVARRSTGGTGIYHHEDLAVSLVLPALHPWTKGIQPLYDRMTEILAGALLDLGVATLRPPPRPAGPHPRPSLCFADHAAETLLMDGRKCVGCSQARRRSGVLVHAFLLFNNEIETTARLFRMTTDEVAALIAPLPLTRESRLLLKRAITRRFSIALSLEPVAVPLP